MSVIAEGINEFIFAKTDRREYIIVGDRCGKVTIQSSTLQSNISVTRRDGKSVGKYISDTRFEFEYLERGKIAVVVVSFFKQLHILRMGNIG